MAYIAKQKLKAGVFQFRGASSNVLEARGFLEFDAYGFRPIVQLGFLKEVRAGVKRGDDSSITMQFDTYGLRDIIYALMHACTSPEDAKFTTGGNTTMKNCFISFTKDRGQVSCTANSNGVTIANFFSLGKIDAMCRTLTLLCNTLEEEMVKCTLEHSMKKHKESVKKSIPNHKEAS